MSNCAPKPRSAYRTTRLTAMLAALAAIAATSYGCGSANHSQPNRSAMRPRQGITAEDGNMAVFRAKVTPVLCAYASGLKQAEQEIAKASADAGGPINASAPESTQAEYASAMKDLASAFRSALRGFRSVTAPPSLAGDYQSFIGSLTAVSGYADRVAAYADARNYAQIAAMENIATPSGGEGVFRQAGITGCAAPAL